MDILSDKMVCILHKPFRFCIKVWFEEVTNDKETPFLSKGLILKPDKRGDLGMDPPLISSYFKLEKTSCHNDLILFENRFICFIHNIKSKR